VWSPEYKPQAHQNKKKISGLEMSFSVRVLAKSPEFDPQHWVGGKALFRAGSIGAWLKR
jgi:hypothetical protein